MWVWCSSRYNFSDYLPETWKPGVIHKFKEVWIVATVEWPPVWFLFAYKWTCYWRPSISLSIWLWSTVQPSIHSCPGELERTLTMQLPKHWDILKAADSEKTDVDTYVENRIKTLSLQSEKSLGLIATAWKSVVWKIMQHTGLDITDFISACLVNIQRQYAITSGKYTAVIVLALTLLSHFYFKCYILRALF